VEEESKDDKVEKEVEEKSKDDRKEGGMLCHCGTPAKREVVKKEGKNKGNNKITLQGIYCRKIISYDDKLYNFIITIN
jgi:hypothetical protein